MLQMPFKPRAQILLQLGEQLIKNENIAILELVKNAYDADAKKVVVNMRSIDSKDIGYIEIHDDGCGMSIDIIRDIWMEPGNSHKKGVVERKERSELGRLPIGEKGIGRFGVHKLGKVIELVSKMEGRQEVALNIDWGIFENAEYLSDVNINIQERKAEIFKDGKTGTYIRIRNLSTNWTRGMLRNLHRSLTALNSPFDSNQSFKVVLKTDKLEWLEGLISFKDIKEYALFECDMKLEKNEITKFEYNFRPYDVMYGISKRKVVFDKTVIMRKRVNKNGKNDFEDINLSKYEIGDIRIKIYAELLRNKSKATNSLVDIIKQALFSVEYRLNAHEIEIIDEFSEYKGNVDVKCASNMIVGAIINIIDNSIYWTTYAKKPERKILFKITEEIEGVIGIVIADNGIGFKISGEDAIKPFVTTKTNGLGLGLNIVSEIMIAQNGTIVFPENGDIDLPQELQDGAVVMLAFSKE